MRLSPVRPDGFRTVLDAITQTWGFLGSSHRTWSLREENTTPRAVRRTQHQESEVASVTRLEAMSRATNTWKKSNLKLFGGP